MVKKQSYGNQAFIDAQNLYLGAIASVLEWKIDLKRFRVYLREKYKVDKAYYFIGAYERKHQALYQKIQGAGFELVFREYDPKQVGKKNKLGKILAPAKHGFSSLYSRRLDSDWYAFLDKNGVRQKIQEYRHEKTPQ